MNSSARFATAALPTLIVLGLAAVPDREQPEPGIDGRPVVVAAVAAPTDHDAPPTRSSSPLMTARRALRWLLAAETADRRPLPPHTFADTLARDLSARPPRPHAGPGRARVAALREQAPVGRVRRVLAIVRRDDRPEPVTLLLLCRHGCRVIAVA